MCLFDLGDAQLIALSSGGQNGGASYLFTIHAYLLLSKIGCTFLGNSEK